MAASFALSWYRPPSVAAMLGKPPGRAISNYRAQKYEHVETVAAHINSLDPQMDCRIEVFTS